MPTPAHILLLDDSRTMRQLLRVYLMGRGHTFDEADSGLRGLEALRRAPCDLVIADVRMADMDGIAFTAAVRAAEGASRAPRPVPIVLITGDRSDEVRAAGLAAGASAFLFKPLNSELVAETVDRLLAGPPSRRP